jgi:hypothetical protein
MLDGLIKASAVVLRVTGLYASIGERRGRDIE